MSDKVDANVDEIETSPVVENTSTSEANQSENEPKKGDEEKVIDISSVVKLTIPISIAMLFVIIYAKFVCNNDCSIEGRQMMTLPIVEKDSESNFDKLYASLINAFVVIIFVCIMTFVLLLLFYFRLDIFLVGYLFIAFFFMFLITTSLVLQKLIHRLNIAVDWITSIVFVLNYTVLGLMCIFWRGPHVLQQSFLIMNSFIIAVMLMISIPEWTSWALLVFLVFWDLIAVLCPFGPLRLLIMTFKKRQSEDKKLRFPPGLLYTTIVWMSIINSLMASTSEQKNEKKETKAETIENSEQNSPENEEMESKHRSPQLGLGDIIFYSLLMGKASTFGDYNLIIGAYVGILVGLGLTLSLLVMYKQALPALPISIMLALIIVVIITFSTSPFMYSLNSRLIHI